MECVRTVIHVISQINVNESFQHLVSAGGGGSFNDGGVILRLRVPAVTNIPVQHKDILMLPL